MLPDVGGRCEFHKLDLDIVIARYYLIPKVYDQSYSPEGASIHED